MRKGLDFEGWQRAKAVLEGKKLATVGASLKAAAAAAGLALWEFNEWVERSRAKVWKDPVTGEDVYGDGWVLEIAQVVDDSHAAVGATLKDMVIRRAVFGTPEPVYHQGMKVGSKRKFDNRLLLRVAEHFNPDMKATAAAGKDKEPDRKPFTPKELYEKAKNDGQWREAMDKGEPVINGKKMDA